MAPGSRRSSHDEESELFILEPIPKPDLKAPGGGVTSLICAGLSEIGLDYDNLILSLLADRLDLLFTRRPDMVRHLSELAETRTLFELMKWPAHDAEGSLHTPVPAKAVTELVTDLNVLALNTTLKAAEQGAETASRRPARSLGADAA